MGVDVGRCVSECVGRSLVVVVILMVTVMAKVAVGITVVIVRHKRKWWQRRKLPRYHLHKNWRFSIIVAERTGPRYARVSRSFVSWMNSEF